MNSADRHPNMFLENERLEALANSGILDTPAQGEFDELTRLAAAALGVASAAVSLIDDSRQWFKARHGIPFEQTPREVAFCTHAVAARELLVVPDASLDPRFCDNPLVTCDEGIRFYAGAPLIVKSGHCLGTLCVFDPAARSGLTAAQRQVLQDLARLATDLIDSKRFRRMGEIAAKVVDATSDAVIAVSSEGRIVYWNPAAENLFGRSTGQAIGQPVEIIIPPRLVKKHGKVFARAAAGATRFAGTVLERVGVKADGSEFPVELSFARWGGGGDEAGFAAIVRDITSRKALERERKQSAAFLDTVVANLPAMLFVKDANTRQYVMINKAGQEFIGRSERDILGSTDRELFPRYGNGYEERDTEALSTPGTHVFESEFVREDGESVHLKTTRLLIDGPDRPDQYILGVSENMTLARNAEAEVVRLAHYDALTGLLNRASYADRLHCMTRRGEPFAMLSIDLDRFKAVNDQFGHLVGDAVLAQVGERLRALTKPSDWIARIGGDEFIAVLTGERLRGRAKEVADAIGVALAEPFVTDRAVAYAGASIGAVFMPEDGLTTEQLRENADLALYRAKHEGRGRTCFFNARMDFEARDRRKLEKDLRNAIATGEIGLAYQPVLSAKTGQITSAEALARWTHPIRGPIKPDIFISLAEECGLIDRLGEQLLRQACVDAQGWPEHIRVAVNLSPLQFVTDNLLGIVRSALGDTGLAPDRLQLEVTEGLVIRDVERTFDQLEALRGLGIQVLIDDFGVGFSSLAYFQRFRFDKVKIDKSFVDDVAASRAAKAIVQAVVGLGEQLEMGVVAEGVETEEQMRLLVAAGCTHLQGYLFSRPLPNHAFVRVLASGLRHAFTSDTRAG